jgi:uncharacterized membrane protein YfcA
MIDIHLPIADVSISVLLLIALGGGVGFLSGLFGVGGGFLITPLLVFLNVPPVIAAATGANTVIAASVSGLLSYLRRRQVDFKMGALMLVGGFAGSGASVALVTVLRRIGQIDLVISLCYVILLGVVGAMMFMESLRAIRRLAAAGGAAPRAKLHQHNWMHGLPFKTRFPRSRLYISALLPILVGAGVGVLSGIMGVGGGFLLVPAMIYLLGMPTTLVVGTSLFQIIIVSANVTILQSWSNQSVDAVLALCLMVGSGVAAPLGAELGRHLGAAEMRILMAILVMAVAAVLGYGLIVTPVDLYSVREQ